MLFLLILYFGNKASLAIRHKIHRSLEMRYCGVPLYIDFVAHGTIDFLPFTIFFQVSFLNGQSYNTLVGRVGKISSSRFHNSYSFYFFEQKQPRYKGLCTSICPIYNFITFTIIFTFFQVSFINGESYKSLVGRIGKISSSRFHTSYSFCTFIHPIYNFSNFYHHLPLSSRSHF